MWTQSMLHSISYLGKDDSWPEGVKLDKHVVLQLIEPNTKRGQNVITDNFFTSVNLAKSLRQQGISIVRTANRTRKEIPLEIKKMKEDLYTKVSKHICCTLSVYQAMIKPKQRKTFCCLAQCTLLLISVKIKSLSLKL